MEESHTFCKWLLGGCGFAMIAMAGTIWKLFLMYRDSLLVRLKKAEDISALLESLPHETHHGDN